MCLVDAGCLAAAEGETAFQWTHGSGELGEIPHVLLFIGAPGTLEPGPASLPGWSGALAKPVRLPWLAAATRRAADVVAGRGTFAPRGSLLRELEQSAPQSRESIRTCTARAVRRRAVDDSCFNARTSGSGTREFNISV